MEIQLIFCLFAFVVNFYLFGYVVLRNPFPKVNRSFILLSFLCTLWNFSILFSFPEIFNFWHKMIYVSASWLGVATFIFLRDVTYPNKYRKTILIISIPSVLLNLAVLHPDFSSYETTWFKVFLGGFSLDLLVTMTMGLLLLYKKHQETNNPLSKRIYSFLIVTGLIAFLGGLSDNLFPGANPYEIGQLSNGIYTVMMGYVIMKTNILIIPKEYSIVKSVLGWLLFCAAIIVLVLTLKIQSEVAAISLTLIIITSLTFSFFPFISKHITRLEDVFFKQIAKQKKILDRFTNESLKFVDNEQVLSDFKKSCNEGASAELLAIYKMDETGKLRLINQLSSWMPNSFRLPEDELFEDEFGTLFSLKLDELKVKSQNDGWRLTVGSFYEENKIQIGIRVLGANKINYFLFFNRDDNLSDWNSQDVRFMMTLSNQFILVKEHLEIIRERQLMERMAIVGQMTVTLAHEIRNPLSSIKFAAKSITENNREKYKIIIVEEVDRLNRLVNDLLDYGKPISPNYELISISELIKNCFEKLQLIPDNSRIEFISSFQTEFKIKTDSELMTQVFLNLMMNSIQAMKGIGKITIQEIDEVTLSVEDDGPGIQVNEINAIFQPFFTTKTEGSGLGLSVVKRILDSMEVRIYYDQNFKAGARFIINFR